MFNIKLIIILLSTQILVFIVCELDDESILRAFSCITMLTQKFQNQKPEPSVFSPLMLTCFIKIKEEELQKILSNIESGKNVLTSKEIEDLTDLNYLKNVPKEEMIEKSKELENAIKTFNLKDKNNLINILNNKLSNKNNKSLIKSFLIMIKNGLFIVYKNVNNLWGYLLIIIGFYFILMKVRKYLHLKKIEQIEKTKKKKNK